LGPAAADRHRHVDAVVVQDHVVDLIVYFIGAILERVGIIH
jgi:hypothetical protein